MEQIKKPVVNPLDFKDLHSKNTEVVLAVLGRIRDSGNEAYLLPLIDMLNSDPVDEVRREILSILSCIKLKKTIDIFAAAIADRKYLKIRKDLLSACWQNGLDFTPHYPLLVQIIIDSDWETAFEAFTIIENSDYLPDTTICQGEIEKIKNLIDNQEEKKQYFLKEIITILGNG